MLAGSAMTEASPEASPDPRPAMPSVPVLLTPRLRLRGHRADDLSACTTMWGDPEVTRHIGGQPQSEEDVWLRILRYVGHWAIVGYGYWLVEERESGRFVGEAGLSEGRRRIEPRSLAWGRTPESGWALASWAHGRGYATEAVKAVLAWADAAMLGRTVCMMDLGHAASRRVAEKCGYRRVGEGRYKGGLVEVFERG